MNATISVTKIGEIAPLWQSLEGLFRIWQNCKHTLANISSKWQIFIVVNGQKSKKI